MLSYLLRLSVHNPHTLCHRLWHLRRRHTICVTGLNYAQQTYAHENLIHFVDKYYNYVVKWFVAWCDAAASIQSVSTAAQFTHGPLCTATTAARNMSAQRMKIFKPLPRCRCHAT